MHDLVPLTSGVPVLSLSEAEKSVLSDGGQGVILLGRPVAGKDAEHKHRAKKSAHVSPCALASDETISIGRIVEAGTRDSSSSDLRANRTHGCHQSPSHHHLEPYWIPVLEPGSSWLEQHDQAAAMFDYIRAG